MNANELATDLDAASSEMEYNYHVSDWKLLSDAATMLRQQQAEIELLNAKLAYMFEQELKTARLNK